MLIVGIAGLVIGIEHRHPYLSKHCTAYRTDGTPDFTVTVTEEMIATEKQNAVEFPAGADDGYFESLAAIREIAFMALSMVSCDAISEDAAVCSSSSASSRETCLVSRASEK